MTSVIIILAVVALLAVAAVIFLTVSLLKTRNTDSELKVMREEQQALLIEKRAEEQRLAYEASTQRLLDEQRRQYERQIAMLEERLERQAIDVKERSSLEFSQLAEKALESQQEKLSKSNVSEIDAILNPLKQKISDFQKSVNDAYVKENSSREALSAHIQTLAKASSDISLETRRLSDALRGNASMQGRWGETILEQLLEKAGFTKGINFSTQSMIDEGLTLADEEGRKQRPDVILRLPGEHKIVIDAKTSMSAYFKFSEAANETDAIAEIKKHVASMRKHVDELASKQYHKNIAGALEHTLMFIPNDAAYLAAIRYDNTVCDYALKSNVAIVSPAHLLSVLQLVAQVWRIENQNRNAEAIAKLGGQLYDKFVSFAADFEAIGKNIENVSKSFNKSRDHLTKGGTALTRRAERLRELGAKVTKRIPETLLPTLDDEEETLSEIS